MPTWKQVVEEIQGTSVLSPIDTVRRKYLSTMHAYTGRNVIAYYSAFLQKPLANVGIDDNDKNAFMQTVYGLEKSKGLDLILHTPGGQMAATESLVTYLKLIFGNDIRAFVPQMAMSAGTMIALSCKEIVMGKQSNIGPIDPQFGGMSCAGVIEEFNRAFEAAKTDPRTLPIWQNIISKYHPTFLGDCEKAISWSTAKVKEWLISNMLKDQSNPQAVADKIVDTIGSHAATCSHDRHIHIDECEHLGIKVVPLESFEKKEIDGCVDLQDCVLTIHHAYMQTFSNTDAVRIIENHNGEAMVMMEQQPFD